MVLAYRWLCSQEKSKTRKSRVKKPHAWLPSAKSSSPGGLSGWVSDTKEQGTVKQQACDRVV